jgi:hypothetical protein
MPTYPIDVVYAYVRLGLDPGAAPGVINAVLANAKSYRFFTRDRIGALQRIVDFLAARATLGGEETPFTDIRKEYHRKAMALHPDRNPDDTTAEERLKNLNATFEIVDAVYREARDYFRKSAQERREIEQVSREARTREAPDTPQPVEKEAPARDQAKADATAHAQDRGNQGRREKPQQRPTAGGQGTRYMAGSVPRHLRAERLGYLRLDSIIGCWFVKSQGGGNYIFDVIMLPEKEFMRAKSYLGSPDMANPVLALGRFSPPYVIQDVKEIVVPDSDPDPRGTARTYFAGLYNLVA